jgi:hypothetical protein
MSEINPGAAPVESTPPPVPYKDRSTGLMVFGILTMFLGGVAALFVALMLVGQAVIGRTPHASTGLASFLPAISIYGILAVGLVWLGIGSFLARRWARALLLIFSWIWLVIGVIALLVMAVSLPLIVPHMPSGGTTTQPALAPVALSMVMFVVFLFFGVFFVVLPAVWRWFYSSRDVKATCEARDPVSRWTDACPLPVLGLCLMLLFSVPMSLIMCVAGPIVVPFFGVFLTGMPGALFYLGMAAIWGYSAWSLYKLEQRGWWLILIAMCAVMVSGIVTFAQHDIMDMYRLMDFPAAQLEQIQRFAGRIGRGMTWVMPLCMLPFLGYLLFIKKFLHRTS